VASPGGRKGRQRQGDAAGARTLRYLRRKNTSAGRHPDPGTGVDTEGNERERSDGVVDLDHYSRTFTMSGLGLGRELRDCAMDRTARPRCATLIDVVTGELSLEQGGQPAALD